MPYSTSQQFYDMVLSQFLYGENATPQNIADEAYLPPLQTTHSPVPVNAVDFMDGPGRFADPVFFELVQRFFQDDYANLFDAVRQSGKSYFLGTSVAITKDDLREVLGINISSLSFNQGYFDDGQDDYASRLFFWSSTSFQISNDAVFVFGPDGTREIQNFAIEPLRQNSGQGPYDNDDFDWRGGALAEAAEPFVRPLVDPFGMGENAESNATDQRGRVIDLEFTGSVTARVTYTEANFLTGLANAPKSVAGTDLGGVDKLAGP